jgi:hypothetical protein
MACLSALSTFAVACCVWCHLTWATLGPKPTRASPSEPCSMHYPDGHAPDGCTAIHPCAPLPAPPCPLPLAADSVTSSRAGFFLQTLNKIMPRPALFTYSTIRTPTSRGVISRTALQPCAHVMSAIRHGTSLRIVFQQRPLARAPTCSARTGTEYVYSLDLQSSPNLDLQSSLNLLGNPHRITPKPPASPSGRGRV